ncbi:MAG: DUF350 domain-containing protein [Sphaerospermopsis sp. SIO1G1]|nr:DUF350 domain-containing protein [Sphaerospermopsis sp. SIO1G1]
MNDSISNLLSIFGIIIVELIVVFAVFWVGQFVYQKLFRRQLELNLELFVKDNPAVAIALVGYYFGIVIGLGGVLGESAVNWQDKAIDLVTYGATVILLMLAGAWVGEKFILRQFNCQREIIEDRNIGAANVEAGNHIANGLILHSALAGETGGWEVALVCWLIGLATLIIVSSVYPRVTKYDVFAEIEKRNNPAAGLALAGLLIATGNIVRIAFYQDFQGWLVSFPEYVSILLFCLVALVIIRWLADIVLVPGVKISDEIFNQEVPNVGAGLIEAFAYVAASFLIGWCFS